jgi:Sec-independent protein translocase protein TatA
MFNFLKNIGPTELLVVALILIVFFGSKVVTGLGKTGGESLREIKRIKKTFTEAFDDTNEPQKDKKGVA